MKWVFKLWQGFQKWIAEIKVGFKNKAALNRIQTSKSNVEVETNIEKLSVLSKDEKEARMVDAARNLTVTELKPLLEVFKTSVFKRLRLFELHEIESKVERLNRRLIDLYIEGSEMNQIIPVDSSFIDSQVNDMSKIAEKHRANGILQLSIRTIPQFDKFLLEGETKIWKNTVLSRYLKRESERRKKLSQGNKKIRVLLAELSVSISKSDLTEAKKKILQIEESWGESLSKDVLKKFRRLKKELREKETMVAERRQKLALSQVFESREESLVTEVSDKETSELLVLDSQKLLNSSFSGGTESYLRELLNKKAGWEELEAIFARLGITSLYHFTDRANLESIKAVGGLFSWYYCDRNNIFIPRPGGDTLSRHLDTCENLQDYVRASFGRLNPMIFAQTQSSRFIEPIVLNISLEVCYFEKSMFIDRGLTDKDHKIGKTLDFVNGLRFDLFNKNYHDMKDADLNFYQAGVLVKTWIPIQYITNINDI